MVELSEHKGLTGRLPWRWIGWGAAVLVLLAPLIAMQFTEEVAWTGTDFVAAAVMLLATGIGFELAARVPGGLVYRLASCVALLTTLALVWATLAVGIIAAASHSANLLYGLVLLVGLVGAMLSGGRSRGMSLTLALTAVSLGLIGLAAVIAAWDDAVTLLAVHAFFLVPYLLAAGLYWWAGRETTAKEGVA